MTSLGLYCNESPAAVLAAGSILTNKLAQGCQQVAAVEGTCCFEVGLVQQRQGYCTRGWPIGPLRVQHRQRRGVQQDKHLTFQPGLKGQATQGVMGPCVLVTHMRVVTHQWLPL